MRNRRERNLEAKPIRPSGKPTTTEKSINAKMALRQSSVLATSSPPPTSTPVARTGAIAWKGGIVLRTSPRMPANRRSEEHTSELQSHSDLVCRLLLEK